MITKLLGNPSPKLVSQIENEKNKEFVLALPKREGKFVIPTGHFDKDVDWLDPSWKRVRDTILMNYWNIDSLEDVLLRAQKRRKMSDIPCRTRDH